MEEFVRALLSEERSPCIPLEDDWFAPLLGDWRFDFSDAGGRRLRGEWFFRRVLEGTAIEDLFICPARGTPPQPDGEYGAAIRVYDPARRCYRMTYVCTKYTKQLEVRKENGQLVCTLLDDSRNRWVFTHIGEDTFQWQNQTLLESGEIKINCEVKASRITDIGV